MNELGSPRSRRRGLLIERLRHKSLQPTKLRVSKELETSTTKNAIKGNRRILDDSRAELDKALPSFAPIS
jgi:hypothetical protein